MHFLSKISNFMEIIAFSLKILHNFKLCMRFTIFSLNNNCN